jgi:hypothetical protein
MPEVKGLVIRSRSGFGGVGLLLAFGCLACIDPREAAVPDRDCGQYSAGGARSGDTYLEWISDLASGMGDGKAVLILEPDALGLLDQCYSRAQQNDRVAMLEKAVRALKAHGSLF